MRALGRVILASVTVVWISACTDQAATGPKPSGARSDLVPIYVFPPIVFIPYADTFQEIAAGWAHVCVRKGSGAVLCWGWDQVAAPNPTPTQVMTASGQLPPAAHIAAAGAHSCAIVSGAAYCWGGENTGELGNLVLTGYFPLAAPVPGGLVFSSISAGEGSTCGVTNNGVACWGGVTSPLYRSYSFSLPIIQDSYTGYSGVAVGAAHACGFTASVGADCWGLDTRGQAGINPALYPYAIVPPFKASSFSSKVIRLASWQDVTCADMSDNTVQCVGANDNAMLGNGLLADSYLPQAVGLGQPLHGVTVGYQHACALDPNGAAWCWGRDQYGQLGNGIVSPYVFGLPQRVSGGLVFRALTAGGKHTCGIATDNGVYCWGDNGGDELGRAPVVSGAATMYQSPVPLKVM